MINRALHTTGARGRLSGLALTGALAMIFVVTSHTDSFSQRPGGANTGIGIQIGQPSGLTLKHYTRPGRALDLTANWDLDNFFFLQGHYLVERHFTGTQALHYYFGPGAFLGVYDRPRRDNEVIAGFSANFGIAFVVERLEFFGQITPRLSLVPATDADIGGGIGLRFYF